MRGVVVAEMSWALLQRAALDGAHAAWFDGLQPSLVEEARRSAAGRRLLARSLAVSAAPVLFGSVPAVLPQVLRNGRWMLLPGATLETLALDIGAFAFAPAIRTRVDRNDVLRLRRVLGARRYTEALARHTAATDRADAADGALDAVIGCDDRLLDAVRRRGLAEWIAFVAASHPVAVERLRLSAPPGVAVAAVDPWLTDVGVANLVSIVDTEAANDRATGSP